MAIAVYPSVFAALLFVLYLPHPSLDDISIAGMEGDCGLPQAIGSSQTEDRRPKLDFGMALGSGWLEVQAKGQAVCPLRPAASYAAEIKMLGIHAGIEHDAAGFSVSFDASVLWPSFAGARLLSTLRNHP